MTIIKDYLVAQNEYYESDQFNQNFSLLENFDVNLSFIEDVSLILKSFKLFPKAIWPIRFNSKFVSKIQGYGNPEEIFYILGQVYSLACGSITTIDRHGLRPLAAKSIPLNRLFSVRLLRERNMFVHIGVEKIPVIKGGIIKRYEFLQYMHFLDILGDQYVENKKKNEERVNYFTDIIYNDPARKDHSD